MALGGGTWLFQNKVLPGAYINFKSQVRASTSIADRGYCAMPLELDWGPENEVFAVEAENFQTNSMKYFGYDYTSEKLQGLRDLFLNAKTAYLYRMSNGATKASGTLGTAKYGGIRGNDITVVVAANVDNEETFDVTTYITVDGVKTVVDEQTAVTDKTTLVDNDYVVWKRGTDTETNKLTANAGDVFSGGANGEAITGLQHQKFLSAIEPYYFNILGVVTTDSTVKSLYTSFVKRMRDDVGMKFQLVMYQADKANYEGVISVKNNVTDKGVSPAALVYWVTGAECSCAVNASCTNKTYDGEYNVYSAYSQTELKKAITDGQLVLHRVTDPTVGDVTGDLNILTDINTFTDYSKSKNSDFSKNQVIQVLDQVAIDIARLFNRTYLGKEQNDNDGRIALWGDIVAYYQELQRVRAIQNFKSEDVPVPTQGQEKDSVLAEHAIQPTCCMEKLYMTVMVA